MTEPAPKPKAKMPLIVKLMLLAFFATLITAFVLAGIQTSQKDDQRGTDEYLCTLLQGGWTSDELAANDRWKDWPDDQSPRARSIAIVRAADRGGCVELA